MISNKELISKIENFDKLITTKSSLGQLIIEKTNFLDYNPRMNERIWFIINNVHEKVKCPICNNDSKLNRKFEIAGCSAKCSNIKAAQTMMQKDPASGLSIYDTNKIKQSITKNSLDHISNKKKSEISAKKAAQTMMQKDPASGLSIYDTIKQKRQITLSETDEDGLTIYDKRSTKIKQIDQKTGLSISKQTALKSSKTMTKIDEHSGLSIYDQIKIKQSKNHFKKQLKNFNISYSSQFELLTSEDDYISSKHKLLKYECNECGTIRESYWPYIRCTSCNPYNKSIGENEVLEYCQTFNITTESNTRQIIKPLELDIYLPDYNVAIEYNGLYYHSSYSIGTENKTRHLDKTKLCRDKNIQLFHIFENEWLDPIKQKIWKSIIRNKLGQSERIYARKTKVAQVTSGERKQFLIDNHIQGDCVSSVNLGLFLDGELISLMTFSKSRFDKKIDWELLRFCNKIGYSVVGGAGKLLKAFRKENSGSIVSYADKRRSNGNLYKQLGFELSHETKPNYFYYKNSIVLESRIQYQKHKLKDKLDVFDSTLTESENMYNNGYRKIYDCGNQVWNLL